VSAEEALPQILEKKPDVVLMDIKRREMSGDPMLGLIKKAEPEIQIIMVQVMRTANRIFARLNPARRG